MSLNQCLFSDEKISENNTNKTSSWCLVFTFKKSRMPPDVGNLFKSKLGLLFTERHYPRMPAHPVKKMALSAQYGEVSNYLLVTSSLRFMLFKIKLLNGTLLTLISASSNYRIEYQR